MTYFVYILYSEKFNKHYTGYTTNLMERVNSHNGYGKDWSSRYRPWKLIYSEEFDDKQSALKREKWLKTGAGRDFIKKLPH